MTYSFRFAKNQRTISQSAHILGLFLYMNNYINKRNENITVFFLACEKVEINKNKHDTNTKNPWV